MASNSMTGDLVTFNVIVNGSKISDSTQVSSIQVNKAVNAISSAKIVLLDGDPTTGTFEASSSNVFAPGNELSIEAGYNSTNTLLFKGIITQQTIRVDQTIGSALEIECFDVSIRTTVGRKSVTFEYRRDSEILSQIIENYPQVQSSVGATTTTWPKQVQYYCTDWDFIVSRAEANGMIVLVNNGIISIQKPDAHTVPVETITYGDNLLEFNATLDAITQQSAVKSSAWNYEDQEIISGVASNSTNGPGNLSSRELSAVIGLSSYDLQTSSYQNSADLTEWSKAQVVKSSYSKIQGDAKIQGTSSIEPGNYITLEGLGDRMNGDHIVSKITHTVSDGNWLTDVSIGLSPNWHTEQPNIMAPPAAGLLPGISGLFNGTVDKIDEDPDGQYRILVDIPLLGQDNGGIWARLSTFYASNGAGAFFLPEVGDEVVLGFLGEDPRCPVILGSLYSRNNRPSDFLEPNEKNSMKAIVSRSGIALTFDDENEILSIKTPQKNTIVLSDKDKSVSIQDENGNLIEMSSSGIVIKSATNISFEAEGNVTLKGLTGVAVEAAGGDVQIKGINISESAAAQYSANGGATALVQAEGELTLKGAMILIN